MKLIALWLAVVVVSAVAATSCSIKTRSGDFECTTNGDCASGRSCMDGLCISSSAPPIDAGLGNGNDAGTPPPDGGACPAGCTSCSGSNTCNIVCSAPGALCNQQINCPPGFACNITCDRSGSCNERINCQQGASCKISCTGVGSCHGQMRCGDGGCNIECNAADSCDDITCGTGVCTVNCAGAGTCSDNVDCRNSCACDVTCADDACLTQCPQPTLGTCVDQDSGCTSKRAGCNTCP